MSNTVCAAAKGSRRLVAAGNGDATLPIGPLVLHRREVMGLYRLSSGEFLMGPQPAGEPGVDFKELSNEEFMAAFNAGVDSIRSTDAVLRGQNRATGDEQRQEGDEDLLISYSEWLDQQGLMIGDGSPVVGKTAPRKQPGEDARTHMQLVREFLSGPDGSEDDPEDDPEDDLS